MNKLLIVANVSKEHIRKFHIPFITFMKEKGWIVDVACKLDEEVTEADHQFGLPCDRNPFSGGIIKSIKKLKKIIEENNYDIVHCNTITGSLIARIAAREARKKGTRVFYTNHGLHYFKGAGISRWIIGYPMESILAPLTDVFITINQADYEMVKKTLHISGTVERIHGIGVNLDRFRNMDRNYNPLEMRYSLGIDKDEFVLIYVAELIENKNQIALIAVMEKLYKKYSNITLVLVGPDHENGKLQNVAKEKGLEEKIKFLGWRNDVPELLSMADVYVASSKSEGLGLNIIEAIACGLPVVAFKNRGHNEVIQDEINGFLVEQNDIDTFSNRIIELYNNDSVKKQITKNAQNSIDKYEIKNVLQELWDIYQRLGKRDKSDD